MAATNYTPIQLYFSTTASAVPLAANLAQGELAINITDGKLYYEDNAGVVQVIATKGAGTIGGSTTQIQYNNAGALAGNAAMTFNSGTSTTTLTTLNLTNALGATYGGTAQSAYAQGDFLYASATNTLSKLGIGTVNYILTSTGSVPQWSAPSSIIVQTATNLAGGAGGSVPYQSAVDTTTFLAIGAANRVMTSTGSAPQWVTSLTGLTGVSSSSITNTSLTSGRVVVSSTGGLQADDADLTFDGTTLSAGGYSTVGLSTLVKTVKIGDSNFSGVAVFAAATPAKLYIGTGTVTDTTSAIGATNAVGAVSSLAITPIAATNTSVTYTNAATLYIAGAPSAGTNVTLTNPYSLYVAAGASYFGGALTASGAVKSFAGFLTDGSTLTANVNERSFSIGETQAFGALSINISAAKGGDPVVGPELARFSTAGLQVLTTNARANITTDADLVSQNGLGILSTSTTYGQGYQYIRLFNSSAAYAGSISQTASTGIGLYSAGDLILGANSATVVTVAPTSVSFFGNSGNNTWGNNYKALDVNGSFVAANGGNTIIIGTGAYLSTTGNWTRTTDSASSSYQQSVGGHVWAYGAASTIGSAISYANQALLTGFNTSTNLQVGPVAASGGAGGTLGMFLSRGATTNFYEAFDGTKSFIGGVDNTLSYAKVGTLSGHDLAIITGNGSKIFIQNSTGKVIVGGGGTPYGKLFVDDGGATNQNSITVTAANGASTGDWVAMQQAFAGSWSTNLNGAALISVTDNLASGTTSAVVGQYGIGFNGGGYFVVKKLYNGAYGGSGEVFRAGISDATFSGNVNQDGIVRTQGGLATREQSFNIDASTNTRVRVDTSNYSFSKFRIYGQRTNGGSCLVYWEGVINNNFNTVYTTAFSSRLSDGTISLTVTVSGGSVSFDFSNSGSGAYGYVVLETMTNNTYVITTY